MIRAIQTTYAGHKFRSRLEARWAIAFNAMGIKWQYECEGFHVEPGGWKYLPDFYLPESRMWVEVKGDWAAETDEYFNMLYWLAEGCSPLPHMVDSAHKEFGGLLLLGPIPPESKHAPIFLSLTHSEGACMDSVCFWDGVSRNFVGSHFFSGWEEIKKRVPEQRFWQVRNTSEKAFRIARQARFEFGETPKC